MVHLYTGNGQGKTSAAAGMAIRALGHGQSVLYVQFMKDGTSGEYLGLQQLAGISCMHSPALDGFTYAMAPDELHRAHEAFGAFARSLSIHLSEHRYDLVILDELETATSLELLDAETALQLLNAASCKAETIVTGHGKSKWIVDACDYITEMVSVRHPYDTGITARPGVEY